jgi:hypothetical protein
MVVPRFLRPIFHESLVGSRVQSYDFKWNALIQDHAPQEQFYRFRHRETEPMDDFFGRVLHAWSHPNL